MALEKTLESPLDCKEIKPVHPKTLNFTGRTQELKSLLTKVKEDSEKASLKLNIQKMKIMASGPITSWETMEIVRDFIFLGSKNTADGDCSH